MLAKTPSTNVLIMGGFLYIVLCGPAITQRGFPPLDPAWTAMTYLWFFPIVLSTAVARPPFRRYLQELAAYCLVTALFNAAAVVVDVPKVIDLTTTLLMTLIFFAPLHLVVGLLVVGIAAGLRAIGRRVAPRLSPAMANGVRNGVVGSIVVLAIAFPFAYREWTFLVERVHARTQAEEEWNAGVAGLYEQPSVDRVEHQYDPATGLKYRDQWHETRFSKAYNRRVRQLLAEQGVPEWSMKKYLVPDNELLALLDADDFETVITFPHKVNANIVLIRGGEGEAGSTEKEALLVAAKESGVIRTRGDGVASVGRRPENPGVIFIRNGRKWIGAFHESGRLLSSAAGR
jgi:hypothetical protein